MIERESLELAKSKEARLATDSANDISRNIQTEFIEKEGWTPVIFSVYGCEYGEPAGAEKASLDLLKFLRTTKALLNEEEGSARSDADNAPSE